MKSKILILIILISISALLSFWPSFLSAHYAGVVSCPIVMGEMSGCQNMAGHMNNVLTHISSFSSMLAFILVAGFLGVAALVFAIFDAIGLTNDHNFHGKTSRYFLKLFSFLSLVIRFQGNIFQGLRSGILNTKVF